MKKSARQFFTMFLSLAIIIPFACSPAVAGDADTILKMKQEIIEMQNSGRLGIDEFHLCSKVLNYASYYPLAEKKIKRGGSLLLYYEPINWFTSSRQDRYEFYLTQDVILKSGAGETIFKRENLLGVHYNTAKPILDIFMTNDFNLGMLPAGEYQYIVVLHDVISGQEISRDVIFEIVE